MNSHTNIHSSLTRVGPETENTFNVEFCKKVNKIKEKKKKRKKEKKRKREKEKKRKREKEKKRKREKEKKRRKLINNKFEFLFLFS